MRTASHEPRATNHDSPRILLATPPFVQLNTPYAATPSLAGFLRGRGFLVDQRDFSLETALDVLSACGEQPLTDRVVAFLQGRSPDDAETFAEPGELPEGPAFRELENSPWVDDVAERAKLRCSLYLDDLAAAIAAERDPDFGFSRYAERLGVAVPDFGAVLNRLRRRGLTERFLERRVDAALAETTPDVVGVTCPFPGTLLGAFRIAKTVRRLAPRVKLALGGGYVSTELRSMDDPRVGRFFDVVMFDEGYGPWLEWLNQCSSVRVLECSSNTMARTSHSNIQTLQHSNTSPLQHSNTSPLQHSNIQTLEHSNTRIPPFVKPSYVGLDLSRYVDLAETTNPMHRLWSDGRWLKLQLARGCYWHKCAFCDVKLDYVKRFEMPCAAEVVDAMESLADETAGQVRGAPSFHFTDEAMPPALVRGVSEEIVRRGFRCRWWGNVRFDSAFTPALARLMSRAGCCAVTGGLECAHDRLLRLMNKGITLESARRALAAFARAGILVHAYLMYGFPTQTEREAVAALGYVRDRFREGTLQSAYFHRFALTVHSPIAANPSAFGIRLAPWAKRAVAGEPPAPKGRRFALNEIPYSEPDAPDWDRIGRALKLALYNYNLGLGLAHSPKWWFAVRGS